MYFSSSWHLALGQKVQSFLMILSRLTKGDIPSLEGGTVNAVCISRFCYLLSAETGLLEC